MARPIAFDITHIVSRLPVSHPSGIDKVDLAYGEHFSEGRCCAAVHYGLWSPRFHNPRSIADVVGLAKETRWRGTAASVDPALDALLERLTGRPREAKRDRWEGRSAGHRAGLWQRRCAQVAWRLKRGSVELPRGAIYVNAAQHVFEQPRFFAWLEARSDVLPVFLLHDLLPLDFPEYFKPGYRSLFARRIDTVTRHAQALITTSHDVAERARHELSGRGRTGVPIHIEPLPSPLPPRQTKSAIDEALSAIPYFVIVGTIEPRKNHLFLLNIWRQMALERADLPKLVIVGARGWENEQVFDILDRGLMTRPHVIECQGLGDAALLHVLANARALLMPSFAEGYGLPVVEALSLGTPVIASDIPVFSEVSQGCALQHHPLDGPSWRRTIMSLSDDNDALEAARSKASAFVPPTARQYFGNIDSFLSSL